jgi:hypothetical protein
VDVEAGVVAVDVWTTVVVGAGAVTVSVTAGEVTVSVTAGAVTVSVTAGSVTVSVLVSVVICATVPASVADPLVDSLAVVVAVGDVCGDVVGTVASLLVAADVLVEVVCVRVRLLATRLAFPEPHPATPRSTARTAAFAAHPVRLAIEVGILPARSAHHPFRTVPVGRCRHRAVSGAWIAAIVQTGLVVDSLEGKTTAPPLLPPGRRMVAQRALRWRSCRPRRTSKTTPSATGRALVTVPAEARHSGARSAQRRHLED